MKRTFPALVGAVAATLLLSACGGADDDTATDPAPAAGSSSTRRARRAEPQMIGDYTAYPHDDYTYDLEVQCFCPYFGQPVTVTVTGGEVTDAVWAKKSRDHAKGDAVTDEWLRLGHQRPASRRRRTRRTTRSRCSGPTAPTTPTRSRSTRCRTPSTTRSPT